MMDTMTVVIVEQCDRCAARALTTWVNGALVLTLCGHHSNTSENALKDAGFAILEDAREAAGASS